VSVPTVLRALAHQDFRRFYLSQLLAQTGTWMQTVAQSWLVLQLTDSPFRLGLIGVLQFSPILFLSIAAGAVADRWRKRRLLVLTQSVLAAQAAALGLLVWFGHVQYWQVAALAFVTGLANATDSPARQALLVEMVGRADVGNAVALNSASFNAARIVGPALAGVLIGRFGVMPAFFLNSVGFLVVISALLRLRAEGRHRVNGASSVLEEIAEGLRYALGTPRIVLMLSLLCVVSLFVFNFTVYVPLVARDRLHLGAEGFGFLMAGLGVGAVAGSLIVAGLGAREPPVPLLFGAAAMACVGLLLLSVATRFWPAVMALFVAGFFGLIVTAGSSSVLQFTTPDALRGRIMGLYTLIWGGAFPIGAFMVGAISEQWGVHRALLSGGTAGLAGIAVIFARWRSRSRVAGC
jgi:predicted MFS family arabinose efflux permease